MEYNINNIFFLSFLFIQKFSPILKGLEIEARATQMLSHAFFVTFRLGKRKYFWVPKNLFSILP